MKLVDKETLLKEREEKKKVIAESIYMEDTVISLLDLFGISGV